jgi:hypothetical protein
MEKIGPHDALACVYRNITARLQEVYDFRELPAYPPVSLTTR